MSNVEPGMQGATTTFTELGLGLPLARAAESLGYITPTEIQSRVIPAVLSHRDVWACAATGSGKTAAFVFPILHRLAQESESNSDTRPMMASERCSERPTRALIVVPTRELANQIMESVHRYGRNLPVRIKTCALIGGISENLQMKSLRGGSDIVIATPGRLLDLVAKRAVDLSTVQTVVLDEADRLMSLGFGDELTAIRALLPQSRQTLLFSATFPGAVKTLVAELLTNPVRVDVTRDQPSLIATLVQRAIEVDVAKRTPLLCYMIKQENWPQVLVFVASCYDADHVVEKLAIAHISAAALHGELSQIRRNEALADFKAKRITVLVATDVAARGIDIASLPVVVNYHLPRSPVDYLHRVGRTARAGAAGLAVNIITIENDAHFRLIEKRHKFTIAREHVAGFEPTMFETSARAPVLVDSSSTFADRVVDPHGGIKGKRPNKKDKLRAAALELQRKSKT
jgi:ATP-dependent RNA helicase RhlE